MKEKRKKIGIDGEEMEKDQMPAEQVRQQEKQMETEELSEEIKLLEKEIAQFKKNEDEYIDRIKRLQADYDNHRKRTLREQIDHIQRANKDLIEKMLPVLDSFESALHIAQDFKGSEDEFYKGVKMIYDTLTSVLNKEGLKVIDPVGEEFNPNYCDAAVTETVKGKSEGTILEVLRKGYMLNDFLIRPAVVKVCVAEK